jgi:hypothetical protein
VPKRMRSVDKTNKIRMGLFCFVCCFVAKLQ